MPRYEFHFTDAFGADIKDVAEGETPALALRSLGYKAGNVNARGERRTLKHFRVVEEVEQA